MDILFTNATILPMTAAGDEPRTFTGAVGVAGNRIALVTASGSEADAFRTCSPGVRVIDCTGRLLMPGLVNTHCHAAMTLQRSYADDIALMEWLNDYIWPFEARQTADDVALGMTLGIVEMLLGGVTSFVDMYYHENRCVEVARRLGIRAMLGCNYFDNNVDEVLPEAEKAVALAADCDRIQIALAPHSPYTVSPENLRRGKELARKWGLHFMTHIAETRDEVRIVRENTPRHPSSTSMRWVCSMTRPSAHTASMSPTATSARWPSGGGRVAQPAEQHEDFERRGSCREDAGRGCAGDHRHRRHLLEQRPRHVRGAAHGGLPAKSATGDPVALPAYEALKLATVNGARAMGYAEGELGVIRPGALADLIVVDLQKPHLQPIHDLVSNLVYCGKASDVDTVVVDGRIVVENRRVAGVDLPKLYADVAAAVERITGR